MVIYEKENNGFSSLVQFINQKYEEKTLFDMIFTFVYDNETINGISHASASPLKQWGQFALHLRVSSSTKSSTYVFTIIFLLMN